MNKDKEEIKYTELTLTDIQIEARLKHIRNESESPLPKEYIECMSKQKRERPCVNLKSGFFTEDKK